MKKLLAFLLFLFSYSIICSQDSIPSQKITVLKTNYKDFVIVGESIYAITNGDSLVVWDIKKDKVQFLKKEIITIAKTLNNELYIASTKDEILYTKNRRKWKKINSLTGKSFKIIMDNENNPIIITEKGIYYKGESFNPKKNSFIYKPKWRSKDSITPYFKNPNVTFLDSKNRIWLSYDRGEFGNKLWFFDLNSKIFYEEEYLDINWNLSFKEQKEWLKKNDYNKAIIDSFPDKIKNINNQLVYKFPANIPVYDGIKGITQDNDGNMYISQSTMHMGFLDGSILIFRNTKFEDFFKNENLRNVLDYYKSDRIKKNGEKSNYTRLEEYLGPIIYNLFDKSIYYYTNKGFFKLIKNEDNYSKELILNPSISWTAGLPNAVGYQMAVKKFEFLDEKRFVFLTSNNGIGYYDGNQVKFYQ